MKTQKTVADDIFRNGPANARGIGIATFRFGMFFWVLLAILTSVILASIESISPLFVIFRLIDLSTMILLAGIVSYILYAIHEKLARLRTSEDSLPVLVVVSFLLSLVAAALWAASHAVYPAIVGIRHPEPLSFVAFSVHFALAGGVLLGWSCLFTNLIFAFELNDRKLRLAAVREEALSAQMRALRYQVNPHFLFNTLNSIAGLIEEGAATKAERMVLSLSTFLRTTLSLDPMHDVTLAEELALQEEYLEIERERFSDRMAFSIDMPEDVRTALIPNLILQPLIENAIKHGVGATTGKVDIVLRAKREDNRLRVTVENDIPVNEAGPKPDGVGVGLGNVADRLRARFQAEGRLQSGPTGSGRYRASIELPLRIA